MNKTAKLENDTTLVITFPYSPVTVTEIKRLPGRRWNPARRAWTVPLSNKAVEYLLDSGFAVHPKARQWYKDRTEHPGATIDTIPGLGGSLYPFQHKGVEFIESRGGRALIGDEMGLGKTVQALAWLQLHPEHQPTVIVCPASLKLNWRREVYKWMKQSSTIISGRGGNGNDIPYGQGIYIINYDILSSWADWLKALKPKAVILDECHYIKNTKAARTKATKFICKGVPHVIALSGTPILNRPIEIFNTLSILDRHLFPAFWNYAERYCSSKYTGFGWDNNGASNTEELHRKLTRSIMIRRLKKDVLPELPPKTRSVVPLDMDAKGRGEYRRAESDFISWLHDKGEHDKAEKAEEAPVLTQIEGLKQLALKGKIDRALDWVHDFLDSGEKLVLFGTHKFGLSLIERYIQNEGITKVVKLDGSTSTANRQRYVDQFQNDPETRLFLGNLKAAGVGITLTAASNVAFLELGWTPGEMVQAEDRIHRIGQEAEAINVWYLLAEGTIEEDIAVLLDKKAKVLGEVLDGKRPEAGSLLTELLDKMKEGK